MPEKTLDFMEEWNGVEAFCYVTPMRTVVKCDSGIPTHWKERGRSSRNGHAPDV